MSEIPSAFSKVDGVGAMMRKVFSFPSTSQSLCLTLPTDENPNDIFHHWARQVSREPVPKSFNAPQGKLTVSATFFLFLNLGTAASAT
jgi:hypothetical protein